VKDEINNLDLNNEFNICSEDLNYENQDGKIRINFNKNKISSSKVMSYVMNHYEVIDFSVSETSIEDIIKKIYRSGV